MSDHSSSKVQIVWTKNPATNKRRLQRRLELVLAEIEYLQVSLYKKSLLKQQQQQRSGYEECKSTEKQLKDICARLKKLVLKNNGERG